jgi:chlorophyllase
VGPYTVTQPPGLAPIARAGRSTPVFAHVPSTPGPAPLLVFVPGFQTSSSKYAKLAAHVASHGFVVVRSEPPNSLFSADHVAMAADVRAVIDWALAPGGPLAGKVDAAQVGLFGHSLGGKVTTMAAADDARVKALFAIDPVNGGAGPLGFSASAPDIVPERVSPLRIPVGFPGETTNGASSSSFVPACAPADQNFRTFYDAATSSPWAAAWDFIGADHIDFTDDGGGFACPAGTAVESEVRDGLKTLAAAFFRRHLGGEVAMEAWLTGARKPAIAVVTHRP